MLVKKLTIENFKAHKKTEIEYGPLTVFIGKNDHGKTSVAYKALQVVILNKSWFTNWFRFGTKNCSFLLETEKGTIARNVSSGSQVITFSFGKEKKVFDGIAAASSFIASKIGVKKVQIDYRQGPIDLNFVPSKSSPFIVGASDEMVQRQISGLFNLTGLEKARMVLLQEASSKAKELQSSLLTYKEEKAVNELLTVTLETFEQSYTNLIKLNEQIAGIESNLDSLRKYNQLVYELEQLNYLIEDLKEVVKEESEISMIATKLTTLKELVKSITLLEPQNKLIQKVAYVIKQESKNKELEEHLKDYQLLKGYMLKELNIQKQLKEHMKLQPKVCSECGRPI